MKQFVVIDQIWQYTKKLLTFLGDVGQHLLLFQWGGLLVYLRMGADGHHYRPVCCWWQRGEADVRTSG